MRRILIIGIGAGNPDHMTMQAIKALNQVDVFFIPNKGSEKAALQKLRVDICERFIEGASHRFVDVPVPERAKEFTDYRTNVGDWHERIGEGYERLIASELGEDDCGAFLVWGDPALYDSTLRIVEALWERVTFEYEVIPGISSVQALAAAHRIPLNRIGEPVLITTGRKLSDGFPDDAGSVVVMLDGEQTFKNLGGESLDIFWGAYLGSDEEILVAGPLDDVMSEIEAARAHAREKNGWIMDTYLLRKSAQND